MYWLVLSTLFWSATYGNFHDLEACQKAAEKTPFYVSASCIPLPEPHEH